MDPARPMPLPWDEYVARVRADWSALLATDPAEPEVQRFLEIHPSMIPGGSGDVGPGGHHGSDFGVVFSQPRLTGAGRTREPDFMWVTRSTGLITPILIEIEKPSKRWFNKDGTPTASFTQAHDQLNEWRAWFAKPGNDAIFLKRFMLAGETYDHRPLQPQYVLVYGRQSEFEPSDHVHDDPASLLGKRDLQARHSESFMTFDSLRPRYDHSHAVTVKMRAKGPRAIAFSPVYGTDDGAGAMALRVRGLSDALARSVMMTVERRAYLADRLKHWQRVEETRRADTKSVHLRSMGSE
jgi:hypothetical protein